MKYLLQKYLRLQELMEYMCHLMANMYLTNNYLHLLPD